MDQISDLNGWQLAASQAAASGRPRSKPPVKRTSLSLLTKSKLTVTGDMSPLATSPAALDEVVSPPFDSPVTPTDISQRILRCFELNIWFSIVISFVFALTVLIATFPSYLDFVQANSQLKRTVALPTVRTMRTDHEKLGDGDVSVRADSRSPITRPYRVSLSVAGKSRIRPASV